MRALSKKRQAENAAAGIVQYSTIRDRVSIERGGFGRQKKEPAIPKEPDPRPDRFGLERKADRLFSIRIRTRDGYVCRDCGFDGNNLRWFMECAHVVRRGYHATRWRDENAICLCRDCHKKHTRKGVGKWKAFLLTLGIDYDVLLVEARHGEIPNVEDVLARFKKRPIPEVS